MSIETLKQALEALEDAITIPGAWPAGRKAITTLRTTIEQREKQEPVAWINWSALTGERRLGWECESEIASEPLYTTSPAAQPATSMSRSEVKAWLAANGAGPDDDMPRSYEAVVDVFYKLAQQVAQPAPAQLSMIDSHGNRLSFVNCTIATPPAAPVQEGN